MHFKSVSLCFMCAHFVVWILSSARTQVMESQIYKKSFSWLYPKNKKAPGRFPSPENAAEESPPRANDEHEDLTESNNHENVINEDERTDNVQVSDNRRNDVEINTEERLRGAPTIAIRRPQRLRRSNTRYNSNQYDLDNGWRTSSDRNRGGLRGVAVAHGHRREEEQVLRVTGAASVGRRRCPPSTSCNVRHRLISCKLFSLSFIILTVMIQCINCCAYMVGSHVHVKYSCILMLYVWLLLLIWVRCRRLREQEGSSVGMLDNLFCSLI